MDMARVAREVGAVAQHVEAACSALATAGVELPPEPLVTDGVTSIADSLRLTRLWLVELQQRCLEFDVPLEAVTAAVRAPQELGTELERAEQESERLCSQLLREREVRRRLERALRSQQLASENLQRAAAEFEGAAQVAMGDLPAEGGPLETRAALLSRDHVRLT